MTWNKHCRLRWWNRHSCLCLAFISLAVLLSCNRETRKQIDDYVARVKDQKEAAKVVEAGTALSKRLFEVENELYQTKNKSSQDPLNYPVRLNNKLAAVADSAEIGGWAPTAQQVAVRDEVAKQIDEQLAKLKALWATDLPAFNKLAATVPAVK